MKKIFTFLAIFFLSTTLIYSQSIIFSEDFDGIPGATSGGVGSYTFPTGWKLANVDNKIPAPSVNFMTNAWVRLADSPGDTCALSGSWYAPAAVANDWMWTPSISLPAGGKYKLTWRAKAFNARFPDGYEVRIMTVAPTGATGAIGNMITNSTVLFSVGEEDTLWKNRAVILDSSLSGQSVYLGFRNNSNDLFLLGVDDVEVEVVYDFDAAISKSKSLEYIFVPLSQVASISLGATITNAGIQSLPNVNMKAEVFNRSNIMVYSASSNPTTSIAAGGSNDFVIPNWTPTDTGIYFIKYFPTQKTKDLQAANDTFFDFIVITDTIYGRDNGNIVGSLGLGVGNGYIGTSFKVNNATKVSSVSMFFTRGFTGQRYAAVIWNTLPNGTPNAIVAYTDTLLYPNNNSLFTTLKIKGGGFSLAAGNYVITAIEFDSTIRLGTTSGIATNGTLWARFNSNPWANVESLISGFNTTLIIRMNLADPGTLPVKLNGIRAFDEGNNVRVEWKVLNESNMKEYVVEKSADARSFAMLGKVAAKNRDAFTYNMLDASPIKGDNFYRIKSVEADGSYTYSSIVKVSKGSIKSGFTLYPNPVKNGLLTLSLGNLSQGNYTLTLFNAVGQKVLSRVIPHAGGNATQTLQLNYHPKGIYHVLITNGENSYKRSIVIE